MLKDVAEKANLEQQLGYAVDSVLCMWGIMGSVCKRDDGSFAHSPDDVTQYIHEVAEGLFGKDELRVEAVMEIMEHAKVAIQIIALAKLAAAVNSLREPVNEFAKQVQWS